MANQKLIARLNELYRESQQRTLTVEELSERDQLRREYLEMIKAQVRESLERIELIDENGNRIEDHKH